MKKSPLCCYLFCAAMSASSAALAATAPVSAGVIHFKGQIVEYGCNLAPHDRNIEVSCLRNNIPHLQTVATPSGNAISLMTGFIEQDLFFDNSYYFLEDLFNSILLYF